MLLLARMAAFVKGLTGLRLRPAQVAGAAHSLAGHARRRLDVPRRAFTPSMIRGFPNNFNKDAGKNNLGGGLGGGLGDGRRVFDELVDFPCVFTFKVIGMAQGDFMGDIVDSVALALETDKKYLKTTFRDRGKYRSITLKAPVNTASQIYDVYAAIDRDPRVKFKF